MKLPPRNPVFSTVMGIRDQQVVIDHYPRFVVGFAAFKDGPTSVSVQSFLKRAIDTAPVTLKYLISDQGPAVPV